MTTTAIAQPAETGKYGAFELKNYIKKSTVRGFIVAVAIASLLLLLYFVYNAIRESQAGLGQTAPVTRMNLSDLPPPPQQAEAPPPPPPAQVVQATGPAARAGNPVAVPDMMIPKDAMDFAATNDLSKASSIGGDGQDFGNTNFGDGDVVINPNTQLNVAKDQEEIFDEFAVGEPPVVDYAELKKLVKYPEIAHKQGIQGVVLLRVLVGKDGKAIKAEVQETDSEIFNKAAYEAVMKATYTPAIQNKMPVTCWLAIPVRFQLK